MTQRGLTRRAVLGGIGGALAGAAAEASESAAPGGGKTRPNIVIFQMDDMRASDWSMLRRTRGLLEGASWFPNYVIEYAYCSPSRASLLTGQFAHNHGVTSPDQPACIAAWRNGGFDRVALGETLQRAGYRTAMIGKFINGYLVTEPPAEGWSRWMATEVASHMGLRFSVDGVVVETKKNEFGSRLMADYAADVIRSTLEAQPLLLYFNPSEPHYPNQPERKFRKRFATVTVPRTAAFNEADVSDKPGYVSSIPPLTAEAIAEFDAMYRGRLQMMLSVDDILAGLIGKLKAANRFENTNIFIVSDNGFMLGEHRLRAKHAPYSLSCNVPMLAWGPGFTGGTDERLVSNVDIAPTCAELAGTKMPRADGFSLLGGRRRDFVPLLRDGYPTEAGRGRGLRSANLMYFEYFTGEREYYDLRNDPMELTNLLPPGTTGEIQPAGLPNSAGLRLRTGVLGICEENGCSHGS